ncbi:pilus assembly protein [Nioella nitratireducens]|uniref:pilus assembly protein n=1 Tax=Nioella nitratireducens TaxID=1287720 RepID=UPI000B1A1099|nr:pilus assembly protein [Nioella nitratireducens]
MPMKSLTAFAFDESGAVTVDWVVLTAALVGLGLAVMSVVSGGLENLSGDIKDQLEVDHVNAGFASTSTSTSTTTTTD